VDKEVFFILIAGYVIHGIDPNVHGCRQTQHMRRPDYQLIAAGYYVQLEHVSASC
jgi:hypothetical protein